MNASEKPSPNRKQTYYLPEEATDALEAMWLTMRKLQLTGKLPKGRLTKSSIVSAALISAWNELALKNNWDGVISHLFKENK